MAIKLTLKTVTLRVCLALCSGCAVAPSSTAVRVQDADAKMVMSCKYLGEVQGSSGWGNLAASAGMENAKNEARERSQARRDTSSLEQHQRWV